MNLAFIRALSITLFFSQDYFINIFYIQVNLFGSLKKKKRK